MFIREENQLLRGSLTSAPRQCMLPHKYIFTCRVLPYIVLASLSHSNSSGNVQASAQINHDTGNIILL